jgi:Family of unknown function (DUF5684)
MGSPGSEVWLLTAVVLWRVFTKAGQPGWQGLIPIWNVLVVLYIAGRSAWWIVLLLIPIVNIVVVIVVAIDLAKAFGRGGGFAIGLFLLPPIFLLILGFGSARYVGPAGRPAGHLAST